jgi:hypothetical protein
LERLAEEEMVYPPIDQIGPDMHLPSSTLERTGYRLPTAAEWEYAARAGAATSRHYGNSAALLEQYAWCEGNSEGHTWPVGALKPNDYGLFDVLGNTLEWCHNWWCDEYPLPDAGAALDDDGGEEPSGYRELRGGAYDSPPAIVRSADRDYDVPLMKSLALGFRIARTCPPKKTPPDERVADSGTPRRERAEGAGVASPAHTVDRPEE